MKKAQVPGGGNRIGIGKNVGVPRPSLERGTPAYPGRTKCRTRILKQCALRVHGTAKKGMSETAGVMHRDEPVTKNMLAQRKRADAMDPVPLRPGRLSGKS